jgi:hypothetical protein
VETPAAQEVTDRRGISLPDPPSAEDIEHQADGLRIVPDDELSWEALNRISLDELDQRRRQAITR